MLGQALISRVIFVDAESGAGEFENSPVCHQDHTKMMTSVTGIATVYWHYEIQ